MDTKLNIHGLYELTKVSKGEVKKTYRLFLKAKI